jgi:hypothetical protein
MLSLRLTIAAVVWLAPAVAQSRKDLGDRLLDLVGPANPSSRLTEHERWRLYVLDTVGPVPLLGEAAAAGLQQGLNSQPEWGQGLSGFGKRFASNMAYNAIRQSITFGVGRTLGEDTRYYASTDTGVWARTRHAVLSTFLAKHDDGSRGFSYASTAGVVGAAAISSMWGADNWKGPRNIAKSSGLSFALSAGFNVFREFLPGALRRRMVPSRTTD